MDVRNVMTPEPACCLQDSPLVFVASQMVDNDCGQIPVVDDYESRIPLGVVTDRDIVARTVARAVNPLGLSAVDCMTTPCITVRESDSLQHCCNVMEEHQIRRVLVVDSKGRLCGILAQADIALRAGDGLSAELVKEVSHPAEVAA